MSCSVLLTLTPSRWQQMTVFAHCWCSADYDAPLSESGEYTSKYHLLRDLLSRYKNSKKNTRYAAHYFIHLLTSLPLCAAGGSDSLPDMPVLHYREAYEPAIMYQHLSLWDALSFTEGVRLCEIICDVRILQCKEFCFSDSSTVSIVSAAI